MIPDYCDPITGYRAFRAFPNGLLAGGIHGQPWPTYRPMEAHCSTAQSHQQHVVDGAFVDAPVLECVCGVYAYKRRKDMDFHVEYRVLSMLAGSFRTLTYSADFVMMSCVWGEVKLWGRVIEHEHGYRAQFAYPSELWCEDAKLAANVEALYGVPCHVLEAKKGVLDIYTIDWKIPVPSQPRGIIYGTFKDFPAKPIVSVAPPQAVGAAPWEQRQRRATVLGRNDHEWQSILGGMVYLQTRIIS